MLSLAHPFISSFGVCEAWQPISARTPEAAVICSHRSCLCAVCSSAKECQVRLFYPSTGPVLFPLHSPEALRGRQACSLPPSGIESHTGLIHLASGNRHLSLRMPPGTHRQGLLWGWGAGDVMHCETHTRRCILTHPTVNNVPCYEIIKERESVVVND